MATRRQSSRRRPGRRSATSMDAFNDSFLEIGARASTSRPGELQALEGARPRRRPTDGRARRGAPVRCVERHVAGRPPRSPRTSSNAGPRPTDRRVKTLALTDGRRRRCANRSRRSSVTPPPQLLALPVHELRDLRAPPRQVRRGTARLRRRGYPRMQMHQTMMGFPARPRRRQRQAGRTRADPPRAGDDPPVPRRAHRLPRHGRPAAVVGVIPALLFRALLDDAVGSKNETLVARPRRRRRRRRVRERRAQPRAALVLGEGR